MYAGQSVFSLVMAVLPLRRFHTCVRRYRGNFKLKRFSCLDQFLVMAFAQLAYRESLRDIETCLRAMQPKLYHMGIRSRVSRNTLANANEVRDWRIYIRLLVPENLAGPIPENLAGFRKEDRDEGDAREGLQVPGAEGYSVGWSRAGGDGGELIVRLGARLSPTRLRVLNANRDPVPGVFVTFSVPGVGVLPMSALGDDALLNGTRPVTDTDGVVMSSALPPGVYRAWLITPAGQAVEGGIAGFPSPGEITLHIPEGPDD